ncbi:MAG TPA: septum site-determining protein MinC [Aliidongia sp.]|uniref:septum site-determining protein MinC n=1 Tax=Aliidongia sp. TaxID=1914230 RepID=UPI002DDD727E|nr:septum site-determining protein MinC [Aliidongia sp.]HEV2676453.1 septum site-determining protein MinC [Aliidongia sp.]
MSADLVHGGMFTVMVVRVDDPNDPEFESRLAEQIARSPTFFANAPVVMDLQHCTGAASADAFHGLRRMLKRQHLIAVGVQNANATQIRAAMNADLAAFAPANAGRRTESVEAAAPPPPRPAPAAPIIPLGGSARTKIITQPVRSGTQVYARGGDLIVLASVSPGAEVIADGHVHIYGALRGRAIAGAGGDTEARIFVGKLEAELLCVAGHYLVSEAIEADYIGRSVQVTLVDDRLTISGT